MPQLTASLGGAPGQAAGVGPGVGHVDVVVLADLRDHQDFLNLRLRLEHEVLRTAAADQDDAGLALFVFLGVQDDGGRVVDVDARIDLELELVLQTRRLGQKLQAGDVHPDRRIARRRGEDGDAVAIGRRQNAHLAEAVLLLVLGEDFAQVVIELPRAHLLLEFRPDQDTPQPPVGLHQDIFIVEQNIVDARDALVPQVHVVHADDCPGTSAGRRRNGCRGTYWRRSP